METFEKENVLNSDVVFSFQSKDFWVVFSFSLIFLQRVEIVPYDTTM